MALDYKIWDTLQEWVYKTYVNALWTNGISWISASSTKPLDSGKGDFELVWLQEEDSLNILRCKHFSMLTFYHVLFLKGTLWLFAGWLKCASRCHVLQCVTAFQLCFTKNLTTKHARLFWQARIFSSKCYDTIKSIHIWRSYSKQKRGPNFMERGVYTVCFNSHFPGKPVSFLIQSLQWSLSQASPWDMPKLSIFTAQPNLPQTSLLPSSLSLYLIHTLLEPVYIIFEILDSTVMWVQR